MPLAQAGRDPGGFPGRVRRDRRVRRVNLRPARLEDAEVVAKLLHLAGPEVYDFVFARPGFTAVDFIWHEFRSGRGYCSCRNVMVAELQGEVVGAAASYAHEDGLRLFLGWLANVLGLYGVLRALPVLRRAWQARAVVNGPLPHGVYVSELGVLASCRNQGVGSTLLKALVDQARAQGHSSVALSVSMAQPQAEQFYRRHGFTDQARSGLSVSHPPAGSPLSPVRWLSLRWRP
jgi:ribosomal protein S18 acetylase RimI-like enzyme